MKILQVISGQMINGALVYCKLLSEKLSEHGHDVTVVCRPESWIAKQLANAEFSPSKIKTLLSNLRRFPTTELRRIAKFVRDNEIDVIHTHMSRGNFFGVILRMMTGVPVVATAHARNIQVHWRWNDYVIANSTATEKYHRKYNLVPARKMQTIHCFPDLARGNSSTVRSLRQARRQMKLRQEPFVIGVVGEIIHRKGQLYLFRALPRIVREVPNFKLVLLGRYHRRESYIQQCRAIQLNNPELLQKVRWLGLRPNVHDFMQGFDLCVVPSIEEPLGLVAIEAMAAGTPVVATRVGGLPEIVQHEENGLLVNSRDPDDLAEAIIRMAKDEAFRVKCGSSGKVMAFQEFDPTYLTRRVEEVYARVVASKGTTVVQKRRVA